MKNYYFKYKNILIITTILSTAVTALHIFNVFVFQNLVDNIIDLNISGAFSVIGIWIASITVDSILSLLSRFSFNQYIKKTMGNIKLLYINLYNSCRKQQK